MTKVGVTTAEYKYSTETIARICGEINGQWEYHYAVRTAFPYRKENQQIAHWLNQNYVVRLCGILDEYGVITAGKNRKNPFTKLAAELRNRVGAHTRGRWKGSSKDRNLAKLIRKYLDASVEDEQIPQFNLSIDTVLGPLKDHCLSFVRQLEGEERPPKKRSCPCHPLPCRDHPSEYDELPDCPETE